MSDKKLEAARGALVQLGIQLGMTDEALPSEGGQAPYGGAKIGHTGAELQGMANHSPDHSPDHEVHKGHVKAAQTSFDAALQAHHAGDYAGAQTAMKDAGKHLANAGKVHATFPKPKSDSFEHDGDERHRGRLAGNGGGGW